ncbi:uncharacterized protein LOC124181972 [Neodiprion fabricii]|uniref:uncharacterized protein LOC124181972 n=1 Tax=Neodiprion fabricii TaxID=2872261 RepID=UPI001ED8D661|nr:uncharacterized protein LOC124181972 [Neodiprion fabricii]
MLIGSGATISLLSIGQINLSQGNFDLYAQKTLLGWAIVGGNNSQDAKNRVTCNYSELTSQMNKFWVIEEPYTKNTKDSQESLCESHYRENTTRNTAGRCIVRLPFREENIELGNSRSLALRRFYCLERRFKTDSNLFAEYSKVMQEYITLGHMSVIENEIEEGYYMPHHPVIKESSSTTKLRVVYNASAKTKRGISLNDALMVGPTIQNKLFEHILRFRMYEYVLTADIAKMYRQVLVDARDRKYQRIFWYHDNKIKAYELNTVTFGVASAPYLAIRTIQQLADDEGAAFPLAQKVLKRDFYVDDFLTGGNSIEEVLQVRDQVIELLKRGGFIIRQWASNHTHALDNINEKILGVDCAVEQNTVLRTLGVTWNSQRDTFVYSAKPIDLTTKITKRIILSEIAKIFDPLGLLGPIILTAKSIMQKCWNAKIDWDESVTQDLFTIWSSFASQMNLIRDVSVERRLLIKDPTRIELHGFCDASKIGYGACLYMRSTNQNNETFVRLACVKSRVSPLKGNEDGTTIPRLELCGALTLSRLFIEARSTFEFHLDKIIFWSDSTTVLQWLQKSPQTLKVFERNRVSEIQSLQEYVP